jgi:hypothetical protein
MNPHKKITVFVISVDTQIDENIAIFIGIFYIDIKVNRRFKIPFICYNFFVFIKNRGIAAGSKTK